MIGFLWPQMLWGLALLPLLLAAYLALQRRGRGASIRHPNLALVKAAMGRGHAWRRHLPPALLGLGLALLVVAAARPTATLTLPSRHETILLAMDVSGSMRATDVLPSRIAAAQAAAKAFIADTPSRTRIGIVAFAGTAQLVAPPTTDRAELTAAIDRFQLQRATAIGSGLLVALSAIFPEAGITLDAVDDPDASAAEVASRPARPAVKPVPPGSYTAATVILLTDGQRTTGPDPIEVAKLAADRGVRVYTVGFGTKDGEVIGFEGWSIRVRLDEDTLKQIAQITQGEYFYAGTAGDLKKVYDTLNARIVLERKDTEITALFALAAGLLVLVSAGLSMWWFGRSA